MERAPAISRFGARGPGRVLRSFVAVCVIGGGALAALTVVAVPSAQAATLTVTTTADSGPGSLRQALASASSDDTIDFSLPSPSTITLSTGPLEISTSLTIDGPGPLSLAVSGNGTSTVFEVDEGVTATISGLTIEDGTGVVPADPPGPSGSPGGSGGGIFNLGDLTVTDCLITHNATGSGGTGGSTIGIGAPGGPGGEGGAGGGIANFGGSLTVTDSTISGNTTGAGGSGGEGSLAGEGGEGGEGGAGGGIYSSGALTVTSSTISGNVTGMGGTGGFSDVNASGNATGGGGGGGGGIFSEGTIAVTNTTIFGNSTGAGGEGGTGSGLDPTGGPGGEGGFGAGILTGGIMTGPVEGVVSSTEFEGASASVTNATIAGNSTGPGGPGGCGFLAEAAAESTYSPTETGCGIGEGDSGSQGPGGAVYSDGVDVTLTGSILADNTSGPAILGSECDPEPGDFTDAGYNVDDDGSCNLSAVNHSLSDEQPDSSIFGPSPAPQLAYNAGPAWIDTVALPSSSVAASLETTGCLRTDERGYGRPATNCSAGAYQVGGTPPGTTTSAGAVPPSPPQDLTGTDGQITLSWSPPLSQGSSPVTSYSVFRFTSTTAASQIATVPAPSTTYVDTNVTAGVTYSYYVEATNIYGTSAPSNVVSVTAPAGPTGPCSSYSGNAAFVCALYEDILGRAPDSAGLSYWQSQLASGVSPTQVAYAIATSNEYRTDYIESDYQAFLGRPADPGGMSSWLAAFSSGATDEQVDAGILGSPEFFTDAGGTDTGFVNAVYQALLGRPADPGGLSTWNADLNSGWTRTQVAYAIDTSNEARTDTIQFFYQTLLNRPADPGGLSTWLSALNSGATDEQVLAGIAGSQEFYTDATGA